MQSSLYQQKTVRNYQNFLAKDLKDQCTGMNIKQKLRTKIQQMSINIFSNQNYVEVYRLFILVYSCQDDDAKKFKTQGYYLPKGVIKNYNVIINGKNFFDQPVDSDLKQYEEVKLTTGKGEDYTAGCLIYIKNHYRLIAVDLSRQKELEKQYSK